MTETKLRSRPEIDYTQLLKEMVKLDLADRLLIHRRGKLP